ncbi:hypothetical protein AKJ16_DCAP08709 [Drosera capensis]
MTGVDISGLSNRPAALEFDSVNSMQKGDDGACEMILLCLEGFPQKYPALTSENPFGGGTNGFLIWALTAISQW